MLPIFLWVYDLMILSKTIKPPLVEASQTSCWSPPALPEQLLQDAEGPSTAGSASPVQADSLPGNLAAARPCHRSLCHISQSGLRRTLGCTAATERKDANVQ